MDRASLFQLLENYNPTNPLEIKNKEKILTFMHKHTNCFDRSLKIGHITASAWLLNWTEDKALLLHHAKLDRWFQLGGHCDGNPDVLAVSIKEAQEESGIEEIVPISSEIFDLDIHLIPTYKTDEAHYHYDIRFLLKVTGDKNFIQNRESKNLAWFGFDPSTLPTQDESVLRMHQKWLKRQTQCLLLKN